MIKYKTILSIVLLMLSVFTNNADLVFYEDGTINPFPFHPGPTSKAWYWDMLFDLVSFSLIMCCIVVVLDVVSIHFTDFKKHGYYELYVFTWMWHRVFWVIAITSALDIIHFMLAARQWEWYFLVQNALFLIISCYFIFKAFWK